MNKLLLIMLRKTTFTILLMALAVVTFGQITTTKVAPKIEQIDNVPYDSTQNFLGADAYKYKGQELYLNEMSEKIREYGYRGFSLDYTKEYNKYNSNIYKCCDGMYSKYNELAGKYFIVLDVIKHPKTEENQYLYGKRFYLKLQEKESKDIVYYEYEGNDGAAYELMFPFIVVGFFEKQKQTLIGEEFVFADGVLGGSDIQTGKAVTTETGQKWKCIDVTIEEKSYLLSVIIENSIGERTIILHRTFKSSNRVYPAILADYYSKEFGKETFYIILQGKVKIGMTKEMCRMSWGVPDKINETITSGKKTEQWVYSDNYLYFDNGKLTAIQGQ